MKAAIYCRVSTKDKEQNPEVQLSQLQKFVVGMQWDVYDVFTDKAPAADLIHRTAWNAMMEKASKHEFDVLLVWKLDRAFRSIQHATTTIQQLNLYKVGFRSYMDASIDTTTPNGMLVFNILASVAQFEKDLLIQRVNAGIDYAKTHGTKSGKPIGRQSLDISDDDVFKAIEKAKGNRSTAARELSTKFGKEVTPGFVSNRLKRASQKGGQKTPYFQDKNPANILASLTTSFVKDKNGNMP